MKKEKYINLIISLALVCLLIGFDQLSKYIVNHNELLLSGEKIVFIKYLLSFRLSYNTGAAWSILEGHKFLLVSISLIAGIVVTIFLIKECNFCKNPLLTVSLILIDAGAVGNLIDRAFYKKGVIDFLMFEFIDFPIFNIADTCLTIGAVILVVYVLFFCKDEKKPKVLTEEGDNQ